MLDIFESFNCYEWSWDMQVKHWNWDCQDLVQEYSCNNWIN